MNGKLELVARLVSDIVARIPPGTEPGPVRSGLPKQTPPETVDDFERITKEAEYRYRQRKGWTQPAELAPDGTVPNR